jgi:hypothetical protein
MGSTQLEDEDDRLGSESLLDATLVVWRPRARRDLTREDARQIVENVVGFFGVLARWTITDTDADRAA